MQEESETTERKTALAEPGAVCPVEIIRGRGPVPSDRETIECQHYESGRAELEARAVAGSSSEPWMNVIQACEPVSMPAFDYILRTPGLRGLVRGNVLDVGAGSCWLTAKMSRLPSVDRVYAVDLSEQFLRTVGTRMLQHLDADLPKVTFVVSDFNELPIEDESIDCALFFASLHHSRAPIKTLEAVARSVRKRGTIIILENPNAVVRIREARRRALEYAHVTELVYTKGELEYLIANARIGHLRIIPLDILSKGGIKMVVRRILRYLDLEAVLINPPTYLFTIEKA